ncbi:MAG: MBOAT family protein [Lentisphaerae bacterium]|nr:MBOAT family protein [Lentisphaerota bacterium]
MVFSSPIFLFLFLPTLLLFYYLARKEFRNTVLLIYSVVFYAWGEVIFSLVMILNVFCNYAFGLIIGRIFERYDSNKMYLRITMALMVLANIGILLFFKYFNFVMDNLNAVLAGCGHAPIPYAPVSLPIGISFFTFQAMSYTIDVYRRETPVNRNPFALMLYVSMFPQLIAGPIVRYHDVALQIVHRVCDLAKFSSGIKRFAVGLGKKVLIANTCGAVADQVFGIPAGQLTPGLTWLGILCYSFQIYYDFSGYSDMAIGLGRMFGFEFLENFNFPYMSRSIREFWRRWHISLSTWWRDYVYIPMGGSRRSPARNYFNLVLVFFLCGLWHGASWTFVVWGLYHGVFLVLERLRFGRIIDSLWAPVRHGYALLVILVGWVLFRSETFAFALAYLKAMAGLSAATTGEYNVGLYLNREVLAAMVAGAIGSFPVFPWLMSRTALIIRTGSRIPARTTAVATAACSVVAVALILFFSAMLLATDTYNPFIYYRF